MQINLEGWVAAYAAIVATGALALEIRRWFETGPRISVRARADTVLLDGDRKTEGLIAVDVVNRGDAPTTLKNLLVLKFPSRWDRWRMNPCRTFVIPHPQSNGSPPILPDVLQPGRVWTGFVPDRPDVTGDIQTGEFWAAVYATDRDRPYLAHIAKKSVRKELQGADKI
ncbi:hypothetical protein [Pannonibacter phragmitetus]|uniref:hypothetical protein n=1 Tax=Pannonibacter phragmitetus TaxID=121719 RepID=UPI0011C06E3A|nr:hypothetical protein [Pannonibacter phragmitetus]